MVIELLLIRNILADLGTNPNDSALDSVIEEFDKIEHGAESACDDDAVRVFVGYFLEAFNSLFGNVDIFDMLYAFHQDFHTATVDDSVAAVG